MVNCLDSKGTGIVFFLLVIFSSLGYSCNFVNDPISADYMKKINAIKGHMPIDYLVKRPRIILKEKEDQNCLHLLTLFLSNYSLTNIKRDPGSTLEKIIIGLQNEIHFIEECYFKIPSNCPNEEVNISTVLENLKVSLAALKPNIENNFAHCLHVKCAVEHTLKSTIATRSHKDQQDSSEHTTPTVKLKDSSPDHISGEHAKESTGKRESSRWIVSGGVFIFIFIVNL